MITKIITSNALILRIDSNNMDAVWALVLYTTAAKIRYSKHVSQELETLRESPAVIRGIQALGDMLKPVTVIEW